jgi:micrococcal nuclease
MKHLLPLLLLALPLACQGAGPPLVGKVVRLSDADTYVVEIRVRAHYGDAPETGQPYGKESLEYARELLVGRTISFTPVGTSYDRAVADVRLGGIDLVRHLVETGNMMADPKFKPPKVLLDAQAEAKAEKRGLWKQPAIAPWDWRKGVRK